MEWILLLAGIAYSIWSSMKKEQREREQKLGRPHHQRGVSREIAEHQSARQSGRRTISHDRPTPASTYGKDVTRVEEVTMEDLQEDFTTRLNRMLQEQSVQREAQGGYERFADASAPETERYRDYDQLASYDDRTSTRYAGEHSYTSHFKLNQGLHKDTFRVSGTPDDIYSESDFADDVYEKSQPDRSSKFSREQWRSFIVMHEVLSRPKALRRSGGH